MIVTAGSTNVSVYFYIVGDAGHATPGEPVTGLLFSDIETGGSASYVRQGAARTDLTLVTLASASAAHTDGGFILVDDTNMPGLYRCDFPDAAFATGVDQVFLQIVVAAANNAVAAPILVDITGAVTIDSTSVDLIWNRNLAAHQTALSAGRALSLGGVPIAETTMTGTPTTTSIQLAAGSTTDGAYEDHTLVVLSGALLGETSPIETYTGATRTCTFASVDAFTSAGTIGDQVAVRLDHVHPVSEFRVEMDANSTQLAKLGTPAVDISADIAAVPTASEILTTAMTEAYAADGVAPTLAEALFIIKQNLEDFSFSGTTKTVKKIDGVTTAATYTLDDPTDPTSSTRAS